MDLSPYLKILRRPALFLLAIPIIILVGIYGLLFTTSGNRLLQPYLASALSDSFNTPITIDTFVLTPDHYEMLLHDKENERFSLDGNYSLTALDTQGVFQGFGGNADYAITLKHFSIDSIILSIRDLDIATLLHRMDYPSQNRSSLQGKISLAGLADRKITGNIRLWNATKSFTPSSILEEDSNLSLDLYDWLAEEDGSVKPFTIDCTAAITLDEIGVIEQLIGYPVRGNVTLGSHVHGNHDSLALDFNTNLANSRTQMYILYKTLLAKQITYTISHADVEKLFDFFDMNAPVSGVLDSSGLITPKSGTFRFTIRQGLTKPHVLKQEYAITQPDLQFTTQVSAQISADNTIHYKASVRSNLGRMDSENTTTHAQMLAELLKTIP